MFYHWHNLLLYIFISRGKTDIQLKAYRHSVFYHISVFQRIFSKPLEVSNGKICLRTFKTFCSAEPHGAFSVRLLAPWNWDGGFRCRFETSIWSYSCVFFRVKDVRAEIKPSMWLFVITVVCCCWCCAQRTGQTAANHVHPPAGGGGRHGELAGGRGWRCGSVSHILRLPNRRITFYVFMDFWLGLWIEYFFSPRRRIIFI